MKAMLRALQPSRRRRQAGGPVDKHSHPRCRTQRRFRCESVRADRISMKPHSRKDSKKATDRCKSLTVAQGLMKAVMLVLG